MFLEYPDLNSNILEQLFKNSDKCDIICVILQ